MGTVARADDYLLVGELSLDGSLRPVRGALSIAVCAARRGIRNVLVPIDNAAEAAVAEGVQVFGLKHLAEVVQFLNEPSNFQATNAAIPDLDQNDPPYPTSATCAGRRRRNGLWK